jgi:activator of 2-hydroxyglutaryl-CoA dehydratase
VAQGIFKSGLDIGSTTVKFSILDKTVQERFQSNLNDGVLRAAAEKLLKTEVIRPDISGLMGGLLVLL